MEEGIGVNVMTVVQVDDFCTRTWIVGAMSCAYNYLLLLL